MFNAIGHGGGFGGFGGMRSNYGGQQGMSPQKMMRMREMVQARREQGLPTPFADKLQSHMQENGFSPLQGMMNSIRSQNAGSFPGANLSQDQRSEIRNHIMEARSDGQVTNQERSQLFETLQSFRQEGGGGWANGGGFPFGGGGGGFPFGGGGGYGW